MILLITNSTHRNEVAGALEKALAEEVTIATDVRKAREKLADQSFTAAVVDESLMYSNPADYDKLLERADSTVPLAVNFGACSAERAAREVLHAVQRAQRERLLARQAVRWELRGELCSDITGLMVCMQQALALPSLPEAVQGQLRSACMLAESLKSRLDKQV